MECCTTALQHHNGFLFVVSVDFQMMYFYHSAKMIHASTLLRRIATTPENGKSSLQFQRFSFFTNFTLANFLFYFVLLNLFLIEKVCGALLNTKLTPSPAPLDYYLLR